MAAKKNYPGSPELASLWAKPKRRPARVADAIKNEIAMLLIRKTRDPRLAQATITHVVVTDDLRTARIFFSVYDTSSLEDTVAAFAKASGFLRSQLAKALSLRTVPNLIFQFDPSLTYQAEMDQLFHEIEADDGPTD